MFAFNDILQKIEQEITRLQFTYPPKSLYDPIEYILSLGGKRIRPALVLMACNLYKENVDTAVNPALGLEVFHNFTLLHDDLMDDADKRRNKPTVHKVWNANTAILSGDAMLIAAYQLIGETESESLKEILDLFTRTALEICGGQQYDMEFESRTDVTEEEYIEMIRLKTAVLLACALKMGAIMGNAPKADAETLYQFGINIGYNSFTYGAQILRQKQKELSFAVPWVVKLRLDSRIPDTYDSSFFASVVRTGLTYGIYSYQLRSMDHHEDMESYLAVIQSHPECAFLWFLSDTPLTEKQQKLLLSCPNLMVSLPIDAPSTASMAKALRRQKTLFGMHKVYQDADAAAYLLSFDHLYSQMEQSVFFFLVADDSCSKESIRAVSDVVQQYRFTPIQPFFPIEVQEDSRKIEQIITAHPAYLLLLPDHMARTLDTPTVSFEELSLRNIFYRELLADA